MPDARSPFGGRRDGVRFWRSCESQRFFVGFSCFRGCLLLGRPFGLLNSCFCPREVGHQDDASYMLVQNTLVAAVDAAKPPQGKPLPQVGPEFNPEIRGELTGDTCGHARRGL